MSETVFNRINHLHYCPLLQKGISHLDTVEVCSGAITIRLNFAAAVQYSASALAKRAIRRDAHPGEIVTLYGPGFGLTSPPLPSDPLVTAAAPLAAVVTFRIGGTVAPVTWAGMIASGLYQFNVQVPDVAAADRVIVTEIAGFRSQGDSVISVDQP